jgi:hypothetical protein
MSIGMVASICLRCRALRLNCEREWLRRVPSARRGNASLQPQSRSSVLSAIERARVRDTLGADTLGEFPERGVVECQLISRPSGLLVGIGMELRGKLFERE